MPDLGWLPAGVDTQQVCDAAGGHIGCGELQVKPLKFLGWSQFSLLLFAHALKYFYIYTVVMYKEAKKQTKHIAPCYFCLFQLSPTWASGSRTVTDPQQR